MLREIVLDTETTGLDPRAGDRLVELGCIELVNRIPTGREFHTFMNPERAMPKEAEAIHGLSSAFLADKPLFKVVADDFLGFIGEAPLVIHNATFDIAFINAELARVKQPPLGMDRVIDTLVLARRKHPAGPNSLDALCKRYGIDNTKRTRHGALVDSALLAEVYVELLGERQAALGLQRGSAAVTAARPGAKLIRAAAQRPQPLPPRLGAAEAAAHAAFVESLGDAAIWRRYLAREPAA